jgi:predicted MPP superfamily phosphohydrolase
MSVAIAGLITVIVSRRTGFALPAWVISGLFVWHFLVLPVVAIPSLLATVAMWPARWLRSTNIEGKPGALAPDRLPQSESAPPAPQLSRRSFLAAGVAIAPPLVTIGSTARAMSQLDEFRVRPITIPLAGLPRDLDGLTIAHVSDIHVGSFTRGRTLAKIADTVNNLRADLVLQTGDLINNALADLPAALDAARRFDSRFGQFVIEGNHDLFQGRAEFEGRVRASGLTLLLNESAEVVVRGVPVQILGLRWGFVGPRDDPMRRPSGSDEAIARSMQQLLPQRRPDAFPILLAHHPHAFDLAADAEIPLTLSGHTHGGQLNLTSQLGFGKWMYRYWSGLYRKDDSALVVSNGAGNWFPLRVNAPAEIVHITLKRA